MSRSLLFVAAMSAAYLATDLSARGSDEAAIRQVVQHYFDGGRDGDSVTMRKAFHPDARMLFVRDSALTIVPIGEFITRVGKSPRRPGSADSTRRRVASIDIAGNAAVAKLELESPDMLVTDYMSLLKVNGSWTIVNKIFSRSPIETRAAR